MQTTLVLIFMILLLPSCSFVVIVKTLEGIHVSWDQVLARSQTRDALTAAKHTADSICPAHTNSPT